MARAYELADLCFKKVPWFRKLMLNTDYPNLSSSVLKDAAYYTR